MQGGCIVDGSRADRHWYKQSRDMAQASAAARVGKPVLPASARGGCPLIISGKRGTALLPSAFPPRTSSCSCSRRPCNSSNRLDAPELRFHGAGPQPESNDSRCSCLIWAPPPLQGASSTTACSTLSSPTQTSASNTSSTRRPLVSSVVAVVHADHHCHDDSPQNAHNL